MDWKGRRASSNVEDRRGRSSGGLIGGGIGTILIMLLVVLLGGNPLEMLDGLQGGGQVSTNYEETAAEHELSQFAAVVLAETEDTWTALFEQEGLKYDYPSLVLYTDSVQSACGAADSSVGPFYCSGDQKVYIDLSFFQELQDRFKAPGDFAMAYVIAHEVGHHVQTLLGTMDEVMALRSRLSEVEFNKYQVRLELQADYYAGVWAHYAEGADLLEAGDIEEALNAASAIGDDRLQKDTMGYTVPDRFTHGTSEQRARWFFKGYTTGTMKDGDTFNAKKL